MNRDSDGTATAAACEDMPVPIRTAKRGAKQSPNPYLSPQGSKL